tara:strand:+ start:817 stop:1047 length:231 start_codon:yes stop_codon:yes gene_type:complete
MKSITSTLTSIAEKVFVAKSATEAKAIVISHIDSTRIKDADKNTIIANVNGMKSLVRIQTYLCNSLLKYEGLGLLS